MLRWPDTVLRWMAIGTHGHTLFPANPTCSGIQTLEQLVVCAQAAGLQGFATTQHTTDPGEDVVAEDERYSRSFAFDPTHPLAGAIFDQNELTRRVALQTGYPLLPGLEANILGLHEDPDGGGIDAPEAVLADCGYVVASFHGAPEQRADDFERRLLNACRNPYVHTIGHPTRNTHLVDPNWIGLANVARINGTAFGLNFNQWFKETGQGNRVPSTNPAWNRWRDWIKVLAESGVWLVIELDLHNEGMWPTCAPTEGWHATVARLEEFIEMLQACGVDRGRVLNASSELFNAYCLAAKDSRCF